MSDVNDNAALGGSFLITGLPAGVYTCAVNVTIPGTLTLNGSATDVWVFKITGKLTQSNGIHVNLTGGALPQKRFLAGLRCSVHWNDCNHAGGNIGSNKYRSTDGRNGERQIAGTDCGHS